MIEQKYLEVDKQEVKTHSIQQGLTFVSICKDETFVKLLSLLYKTMREIDFSYVDVTRSHSVILG